MKKIGLLLIGSSLLLYAPPKQSGQKPVAKGLAATSPKSVSKKLSKQEEEDALLEMMQNQATQAAKELVAQAQPQGSPKAKLKRADYDNLNALLRSINDGAVENVRYLVSRNLNIINLENCQGFSPLFLAAGHGNKEIVEILLQHGADPNSRRFSDGGTALMHAVHKESKEIIEMLLKHGADPNLRRFSDGITALMYATQKKSKEIVEMLLNNGADPDMQLANGNSALSIAAQNGYKEILEMFLKKENRTAEQHFNRRNALNIAIEIGNDAIFEMLLPHVTDLSESLFFAIGYNQTKSVEMLLKHGVNPNARNADGATALMIVVRDGHKEIAEMLLKHGADPNAQIVDGSTALMIAAQNGYKEIVEMLLEHAANNPNAQKIDGATALMIAAQDGQKEIVEMLLEHGADPNLQGLDGATALMLAAQDGHKETVELLLEQGADPNLQTGDGSIALMFAAEYEHKEIVEMLLKHGADPNLQDDKKLTALMIANFHRYTEIVDMLLANGAKSMEAFREEDKKALEDLKDAELKWLEQKREELAQQQKIDREKADEEAAEQARIEQENLIIKAEKDAKRKQELLEQQEERTRLRQEALERKKESALRKKQLLEDEKNEKELQEKEFFKNRVKSLVKKVSENKGHCLKKDQKDIASLINQLAILIPLSIKVKCEQPQKLFKAYDATIEIDHIVNARAQFVKVANQDNYNVVFTGGHSDQSVQRLLEFGFVTLQKKVALPNGCCQYTLINNFDGAVFVKTTFPQDYSVEMIVDLVLGSDLVKEEKEYDLMGRETIIVVAQWQNLVTRNILQQNFFTNQLVLQSCYPIIS